jgi:hypothetical protein
LAPFDWAPFDFEWVLAESDLLFINLN